MESVLRTHHLGKRYGSRWAVRDLNLEVLKGEVFGFLGPNGAGKSTTIRMLLSLIRPTTGDVELFEKSLRRNRRECLARVGGLVEEADFYLYLSARKNLEIVGTMRGGVGRKEVDRVLDIVGLSERADDRVKTYSHGMKQRLGIAQSLLGNPECVVLDEPTTGLDPQGIKEVRDLVRQLSADRRMTIFLSSHLLSEIEQTATSMAIIHQGTLLVQGTVQELLSASANVVRFEVQPLEQARIVLTQDPAVREVRVEGDALVVSVAREETARLNAKLINAGVEVRALVPRRSLEDYFLNLTEVESAAESSRGKDHA